MTRDELTTVLETVGALWPHTDAERRIAAGYTLLLGDLPAEPVIGAIRTLALEGREFAPPPGIVRRHAEMIARPLSSFFAPSAPALGVAGG